MAYAFYHKKTLDLDSIQRVHEPIGVIPSQAPGR